MRKKILATLVIILLVISFSINVLSFNDIINEENNNETNNLDNENAIENKTLEQQREEVEKKVEESNSKLQYVESELGSTLQKVEELEDSLNGYQSQYEELNQEIIAIEQDIQNTNATLEEIQDEYDRKQKILKKRIVALYETGDTTYLDLLISSQNLIEFISNYFLVGELLEYDSELLDSLDNTKNKIARIKLEQEQKEVELRTAKAKINQTKILLENTKIVKENYMLQLTEEERVLQEQIAQYKAEQEEIERQILAAIDWTGTFSIQFTGGAMIWPIAMEGTYITSGYGNRLHPIQGVYKNHDGIDISGLNVNGAPVVAAADGIVSYSGWITGYGNSVIINHGSGIFTLYGHGLETIAKAGDTVKQGDIIMKVGSTGNSTGPHLHFEVRKNGVSVDPIPYLNGEIEAEELYNGIENNINIINNNEENINA